VGRWRALRLATTTSGSGRVGLSLAGTTAPQLHPLARVATLIPAEDGVDEQARDCAEQRGVVGQARAKWVITDKLRPTDLTRQRSKRKKATRE
jgi:hypothetical protein